MNVLVLVGVIIVSAIALIRFNSPVPSTQDVPRSLPDLLKWLFRKEQSNTNILPPPRANTTAFKYWLYRITYTLISVVVYIAVYFITDFKVELSIVFQYLQVPLDLKDAGPFVVAVLVASVFPSIPPFRSIDVTLRHFLYEQASIPAHQLSLQNRLKHAPYHVDLSTLERVRSKLEAEGFQRRDLIYEDSPTARSLWIKTSVLIEHLSKWQGEDKYKTAFAVLKEHNFNKRTIDVVNEVYEALKSDA